MYWFLDLEEALQVHDDSNDFSRRPPAATTGEVLEIPKGYSAIPLSILAQIPGVMLDDDGDPDEPEELEDR